MPRYKATGIIEGMAIRRRKEEASRLHLTISIPIPDNQQLLLYAAANQGNAIDFTLEQMQGALFAAANLPDSDDEEEEDESGEPSPELEQIFAHDVDGADVIDRPEYGSLGSGEPGTDPLIDKLLEGAQDDAPLTASAGIPTTEEERAQAIANLASESTVAPDHEPPLPLRSRARTGTGPQLRA